LGSGSVPPLKGDDRSQKLIVDVEAFSVVGVISIQKVAG
jgi:hypothetical protein